LSRSESCVVPSLPASLGDELQFLRGLVLGMRCGVLTVDRDARLVLINEPATHILDLARAPSAGTPIAEALAGHPQLARVLGDAFTVATLPNRAEIDLARPGGGTKTIGFTLSMVPGSGGRPAGAAAFFKDLTQIEHKAEQERLRDRLVALGQMAANVAHEIRNPLASIEVTCALLKRRLPEAPEAAELIDKVLTEVRRLNRTMTSSLEFVRPIALQLGYHALGPVLDEALAVATDRCPAPGVRVLRAPVAVPPFLMDRAQLRQVFENLFLNALEAMAGVGELRIETATQLAPASGPATPSDGDPWGAAERYAVVRVGDTGPGIPEEHRDRLFFPFFTTKKQGSGVGLPMARKIVDSHRGLLDVESEPGRGAVFIVRIPMACEPRQESAR